MSEKGRARSRPRHKGKKKEKEYRWRSGAPMRAPHLPSKYENSKYWKQKQTKWHRKMFGPEEDFE